MPARCGKAEADSLHEETVMLSEPFVGEIVHYVARGSADGYYPAKCRAAIVAEVPEHRNLALAGRETSP